MYPQSVPLTIVETVLKESDDLVILGVNFDSKLTIEKHLRSFSRGASQRIGVLRKSWRVLYPEWPHRQGGCLACCGCTFDSRWGTGIYYARSAQGALPMRVGGATTQLDPPSLTPLSVAGCG